MYIYVNLQLTFNHLINFKIKILVKYYRIHFNIDGMESVIGNTISDTDKFNVKLNVFFNCYIMNMIIGLILVITLSLPVMNGSYIKVDKPR